MAYNQLVMAKTEVNFTFDQATRTMGVTPERLQKLIDEGKISVARAPGKRLISREAILSYLAEVSAVPLKQRKK